MPYSVNFTDKENKTPITVFDNTQTGFFRFGITLHGKQLPAYKKV
jgi:hypothetical protein